ncbi:7465_t:CDS:2, partial [Entrophospora sp. SA101]
KPIPTLSDHTIPSSKWIILMPSSNTSNLSQWSINKIKEEMTKYSIEVDNDDSCVELIALLQEAIDNETKKKNNFSTSPSKLTNNKLYWFSCRVDYFVIGWVLKENQVYGKKGSKKQIDMLQELEEQVESGELASEELPTIRTIEGWISHFAAPHKKSMAQKLLEECQNKNK